MILNRSFYLLIIIFVFVGFQNACAERLNVTERLKYIGSPYKEHYPLDEQIYARNVWDMIEFEGKLYLGAGNSSNFGPSSNAGPVPIIRYNPETQSFSEVFIVDEEQIDTFYLFDNQLYVPGHDPREGWKLGNYYTLKPGKSWKKHRNIPNAIHTYGLTQYQGRLFAALGVQNKYAVAISPDLGQSWKNVQVGTNRIYDFLESGDNLYAIGTFFSKHFMGRFPENSTPENLSVFELLSNDTFKLRKDLSYPEIFFPNTDLDHLNILKIVKPKIFKGKCIFIGAEVHNDHQSLPFGLFVSSSLVEKNVVIERVPIPSGTIPWDMFKKNNSLYLLVESRNNNSTEVSVWRSNDATTWHELFFFTATTFARSFELLGEYWYFSLGSEQAERQNQYNYTLSGNTGIILRLKNPK